MEASVSVVVGQTVSVEVVVYVHVEYMVVVESRTRPKLTSKVSSSTAQQSVETTSTEQQYLPFEQGMMLYLVPLGYG